LDLQPSTPPFCIHAIDDIHGSGLSAAKSRPKRDPKAAAFGYGPFPITAQKFNWSEFPKAPDPSEGPIIDKAPEKRSLVSMSFTDVKAQVDGLTERDQEKLSAYLTFLRKCRDPAFRDELKRRYADKEPDQWVIADVPETQRHP
jgi:hypothetical protein